MPSVLRLLPASDDIYQHSDAHLNEKNDKDRDGGQLSPRRISIRETRTYPYQKGEGDKKGEIPPPAPPPSYTLPSYTLTTPFNTQRVINTVKLKLLSVF